MCNLLAFLVTCWNCLTFVSNLFIESFIFAASIFVIYNTFSISSIFILVLPNGLGDFFPYIYCYCETFLLLFVKCLVSFRELGSFGKTISCPFCFMPQNVSEYIDFSSAFSSMY